MVFVRFEEGEVRGQVRGHHQLPRRLQQIPVSLVHQRRLHEARQRLLDIRVCFIVFIHIIVSEAALKLKWRYIKPLYILSDR